MTATNSETGSANLPICRTCGVQYGAPRKDCPICEDERQYVGWDGQQWTTLAELRGAGYHGDTTARSPKKGQGCSASAPTPGSPSASGRCS
jgi:hypothetical protein